MSEKDWSRREILKAIPAAALVAHARPASAESVKFSAGTEQPRLKAPANACDCHHHVYDARFPVDLRATLRPADALVADYRALQKRIGTTRNVLVQPSTYGTDNRCHLEALAAFGPTARMVAVVDDTVSTDELKRMHGLGVRGIRFNLAQAGATTPEMMEPLSKRINDLGWHIQINAPAAKIMEVMPILERVPSPIVFDHLAQIPQPEGVNHPLFARVRTLMDRGRTWVKLSGAYGNTKVGPPTYSDSSAVARAYAKAAPERCVWGSDWPHPTEHQNSCRTTPSSSICSPTGCPTTRRGTVSSWRTRRCCTTSRRAVERAPAGVAWTAGPASDRGARRHRDRGSADRGASSLRATTRAGDRGDGVNILLSFVFVAAVMQHVLAPGDGRAAADARNGGRRRRSLLRHPRRDHDCLRGCRP
jgi:D-galactarolactone isomerase